MGGYTSIFGIAATRKVSRKDGRTACNIYLKIVAFCKIKCYNANRAKVFGKHFVAASIFCGK